jgi:hypothetical protein
MCITVSNHLSRVFVVHIYTDWSEYDFIKLMLLANKDYENHVCRDKSSQ